MTADRRHPRDRAQLSRPAARRAVVVLAICAAAVVALWLSGSQATAVQATAAVSSGAASSARTVGTVSTPTPSSQPAQGPGIRDVPPPLAPSPGQSPVDRGLELYQRGCAGCHGQSGGGSERGPSLLGVGPASTDFQLSTGRMPLAKPVKQPPRSQPAYDQQDIDALVAYIDSLATGTRGQPIPQLVDASLQSGRRLYLTNCASCHSSSGVGAVLPDGFVAPPVLDDTPQQVAEAIRVGPGVMPPFPSSALDDQKMSSIVRYVQAIPSHDAHGGWRIGSLGPLTEGLVGWVVGLGLLGVVIRLLGRRAKQ